MNDDSPPERKPAGAAVPPPDLPPRRSVPPIPPVVAPPPPPAAAPENPGARVKIGAHAHDRVHEGDGLATFNQRLMAVSLDIVVALGLAIGLQLVLPGFADRLGTLVGVAYLLTRDSLPFLDGQSVGKKALQLRAVTRLGEPLTGDWRAGLIRNGVLFIPLFALVELFVLLSREDKPFHGHRLGDEWAGTKVRVEPRPPVDPPDAG